MRAPSGDDRPRLHRPIGWHGLTVAEIHYYRPDAPSLLQLFVWQEYDLAPDFPVLFDFLDHWRREIEAALHSVYHHVLPRDKTGRPTLKTRI